jgi:hypothetical protein
MRSLLSCRCNERHYERDGAREATVMRHFLRVAAAPSTLPCSVSARPTRALLIAPCRTPPRVAPRLLCTALRAVAIAPVAVATDAHLLCTARAVIQPIAVLACPHPFLHTRHWTTPRFAGIKASENAPLHARSFRRPGASCQNVARAFVYQAFTP